MSGMGLLQHRSAEEMRADDEDEAQRQAEEERRRQELIESSLGSHIQRCWENAKMARQQIEYRMLDCLRRRKGEYDPSKLAAIRKEGGAEIYMMLTATKCRAAAAWVRDIMIPSRDKPWGLEPTPVPEVPDQYLEPMIQQIRQQAQQMQQQGQQVDMASMMEEARGKLRQKADEAAREATDRHEELIADQLAEGDWDDAFEAFIDDFVTYPAAFIRAPVFRRVPELKWLEGWKPIKGEKIRPEFERVSPFDLYPSPDATNIDDGAYILERARFTRSHLNQMIGVPSYNTEAIRRVLDEYGQGGLRDWLWTDGERAELQDRGHEWLTPGETIDGLIYSGGAQGVTLLQWGLDPDEVPDPLAEYEVEAILIGRHVVRVRINQDPLERRPYHKASFQPVPGSFWGQGIPELMADIQDVCNATARGLVNNLAISSGPQVEVFEERLQPTEDPTDMYPWKVWRTQDSNVTGNNPAVRFFQASSNASELLSVYDQFERKADDATNIPRYLYGNEGAGGAGETASGLSMLMESANKGIKDAIRHIDRGVMRRVIEALWLHNMQYSDDNSIKGDASVVARGSSAILAREQTDQLRQQFLQMTANEFDMGILGQDGRRRLLESVAEKLDLPNLVPSEEEMQENMAGQKKSQQADDQLEKAKTQAEIQEKQAQAQRHQADAENTQIETQDEQKMAPLEAQKLLAEIAKLISETQGQRDGSDDGTGLESAGPDSGNAGRGASGQPAQANARGQPGQSGAMPRSR
ncbi:hypothetical protein [Chromohalobacter sp. 296-RDG]|uniref:portal protein n=1 Tax=Chromohalobacter sp. 296-RDG TaxID=2994062 RepID=UPI002469A314|nr:hypothetical protein [Chromohalobacter sp. 296-RDG]